jgi:glucose-6-phosphate isomerase
MSVIEQRFFLNEQIPSSYKDNVERCRKDLFADMQNMPLLLSSETDQDIAKIKDVAQKIEKDFKNLIIIGTGASESIPRMFSNLGDPKLHIEFLTTLDQYTLDAVLKKCNLKETALLVISKSGFTSEVMALTLFLMKKIKNQINNKQIGDHFYFITSDDTPLFKIAKDMDATILKHTNIGGRFATFSSLGFLSAALSGMNVDAVIDNTKTAFLELIKPNSWVMEGVAYNYFMSHNFSSNIFMYYHDSLYGLSLWVRQLIAESLGKDGKGLNAIVSNGVLDHHSQLQLYLDGLNDKFFTVLSFKSHAREDCFVSEEEINKYSLEFAADTTLSAIHELQMNLAIEALIEKKKNIRVITASEGREKFIAELVMGMMLEVMMFAYLNDINPFDQPAVEVMKARLKGCSR